MGNHAPNHRTTNPNHQTWGGGGELQSTCSLEAWDPTLGITDRAVVRPPAPPGSLCLPFGTTAWP